MLDAQRRAEVRGVSPVDFARRLVERPLKGTSALKALVEAQANARISIIGMEPLSELLRVGRR